MRELTILDIAKMSGVSKSTVSRVLNNDSNVKEETRKKVLKVIEKNKFIPSTSARILRGKKTKTIGIVTTRLDSNSENEAIRGILRRCEQFDYSVVLVESLFSIEKTKRHVENLLKRSVDGFIIFAIGNEKYDFMLKLNKPVVMIGQKVEGFNSIVYDNYEAIHKLCGYLWNQGKRNIGYIGIGDEDPTTGKERNNAYKDFASSKGMKQIIYIGNMNYSDGYKLAELCFNENVDAIICATDTIALGTRKFLLENEIKDIFVAGVGNNKLVKFIFPEHLSIKLFYENSGIRAAEILERMIKGENISETIVIHSELCL
ncbi:MAG: LacI family DNA-binding transcriptional regulator [Clostridium sp.]|uniref:LacI family DNA-binding transcriptional regulator n=1 Tax=Clostridium sp. TaxID=1506 RepID=UPI0039E87ED4